jgi:hypothetical protein
MHRCSDRIGKTQLESFIILDVKKIESTHPIPKITSGTGEATIITSFDISGCRNSTSLSNLSSMVITQDHTTSREKHREA